QAFSLKAAEICLRILDQRGVADTRLEIAPDVIEVHVAPAQQPSTAALRARRRPDKRNVVIVQSSARMTQAFFGSGSSTGAPDFFHALKPPLTCATGLSPIRA